MPDVIYNWVNPFVQWLETLGVPRDIAWLGLILVPAAIWIGAAVHGASAMSGAGGGFTLHFVLGLAIPIVYPLVAPRIRRRIMRERRRRRQQEIADAMPTRIQLPPGRRRRIAAPQEKLNVEICEPDSPKKPAQEAADKRDAGYFQELMAQQTEDHPVRLAITYDGDEMIGRRILEVLPHALVIQAAVNDDGETRSVRVPFAKIERVRQLETGTDY